MPGPPAKKLRAAAQLALCAGVGKPGVAVLARAVKFASTSSRDGTVSLSAAPAPASAPGLTTRLPAGTSAAAGAASERRDERGQGDASVHVPTLS